MSARKRNRLPDDEIDPLFEGKDLSDLDSLDLESSSSESSSDSDQGAYSSFDINDL